MFRVIFFGGGGAFLKLFAVYLIDIYDDFHDSDVMMKNLNDVFGVCSSKAVLKAGVDCDT